VCNLICAGLVLGDLLDGAPIDIPDVPPVDNAPQSTNPHMNTEEGTHLNTFRHGVDERVMPAGDEVAEPPVSKSQRYDGTYECQDSSPKSLECLEKGDLVAHWIMQRVINTSSFCDYETHNCDALVY